MSSILSSIDESMVCLDKIDVSSVASKFEIEKNYYLVTDLAPKKLGFEFWKCHGEMG